MVYLYLFLEFFKIGLFTFGGGYAMIPLVKETVLSHGWLTESQFVNFLGVCESTPGPIAINMATYVGSVQGGILGSLVATIGVVLPSFIIILVIAAILKNFIKNISKISKISSIHVIHINIIPCFFQTYVFSTNSLKFSTSTTALY
jgi:chromate transporter